MQYGSKRQRRKVVNRWPVGKPRAPCFDGEAEKAEVGYSFANVTAQSWNEQPPPRNPSKRKRWAMSREWDNRAEQQGGIIIGIRRRTVLLIFVIAMVLGAAVAWLGKMAFGL
jgi:hypothetical protein